MAPGPTRTLTPRRILAVDDDPVSLAIAAVLLESDGWTVTQPADGEQALDLLAHGAPPDCVLADLRMPGLAGPELAHRLHRLVPRAILLAMSATPPPTVEGYHGVLKKPLSLDALGAAFSRRPAAEADPEAHDNDSDADILDPAVFGGLRRAMSLEALTEIVNAFLEDASARIQAMRSADPQTLRRQAHTLKGGAAMVGARQVAQAAAAVELGIDQEGDRRRILDEMEAHCRRAEAILLQRIKS